MESAGGVRHRRWELTGRQHALPDVAVESRLLRQNATGAFLRIQYTDRFPQFSHHNLHRPEQIGVAADDDCHLETPQVRVIQKRGS